MAKKNETHSFATAKQAIAFARNNRGFSAIYMDGYKAMPATAIENLDATRNEYAFLCERDGRIMTIPCN